MTVVGAARRKLESPDRLVVFSDAVLAIAITLLAIELPVPDRGSRHLFLSSLNHDRDQYLAFIVSFWVVALAWRGHHRLLALVTRIDGRFEMLNFSWLLTIVLLPFAAKLLTLPGDPGRFVHACCFGFYALLEAAAYAVALVMVRHATATGAVEPDCEEEIAALEHKCIGTSVGFALSIPLFFVVSYGWVLWILAPNVIPRVAARVRLRG